VSWKLVKGSGTTIFWNTDKTDTSVTFSAVGTYILEFAAGSGNVSSGTQILVRVLPALLRETSPVVTAGKDITITQPESKVTLSGTVTPMEMSLGWSQVEGPAKATIVPIETGTDEIRAEATVSETGKYVFYLYARDGGKGSSAATVVYVKPALIVNKPPAVDASGPGTVDLLGVARLSGTVYDDGLPATGKLSVLWTAEGPGEVEFTRATAVTTDAYFNQEGTYKLTLTANDGDLSSSADVTIEVK
jgi:hypothetical protein